MDPWVKVSAWQENKGTRVFVKQAAELLNVFHVNCIYTHTHTHTHTDKHTHNCPRTIPLNTKTPSLLSTHSWAFLLLAHAAPDE